MSGENNLINLGDLSKPAVVLIERISNAIGLIYEPTHKKRVAKADAEVARIKALAEIDVTDIQQRALQRMVYDEGKKQENIESITAQAALQLNNDASPQGIEDDWLSNFFDKCKNISNAEMQSLWAGLLAREANSPGSYSKRTIELISMLDKADANLFTTLCGFCLSTEPNSGKYAPVILDVLSPIYKNQGLTFLKLNHLDSIGLIKFSPTSKFRLPQVPKTLPFFYYDSLVLFQFAKENSNQMPLGQVMLTSVGEQLAPICGAKPIPNFLDYIISEYAKNGASVTIAPHAT